MVFIPLSGDPAPLNMRGASDTSHAARGLTQQWAMDQGAGDWSIPQYSHEIMTHQKMDLVFEK